MRIRPGGPDDIAAVLALGDEAVRWMNAREIGAALIGRAKQEAAAHGMRLADEEVPLAPSA